MLKWGSTKDRCGHIFFLKLSQMLSLNWQESELLYADDLIQVRETIDRLRNKFIK